MSRRDFPIGRNDELLPPLGRVAKGREASKALRHWEAGERRPSGAARTLLHVIANQPAAVRRALRCRVFRNDERHLLPGVTCDEQEIRLRIHFEEDESRPPQEGF